MIVQETENRTGSNSESVLDGLPQDAELQRVSFVAERNSDQHLLLEFPQPSQCFAVLENPNFSLQNGRAHHQIQVLTIPTTNHQDDDLQAVARNWVAAAELKIASPLQMMTLQGAQVFWNASRVGILAPAKRLASVRLAMIEACWYDAELSEIERSLGAAWPDMESDMPLAFEFNERAIKKRPELVKRFERVAMIRSRFARLAPQVYCPHLHPPTLASQVGERFRERSRMAHRHEILGEQIEVFEKIYDACGQRASDFVQSRTGHVLEWIIIVLLMTQTILWGFEFLTGTIPEDVSPTTIEAMTIETTNVQPANLRQ
jgi:hypothetical protein